MKKIIKNIIFNYNIDIKKTLSIFIEQYKFIYYLKINNKNIAKKMK